MIVQGKEILLRQGDGLIEPGGQLRFDFDAWEGEPTPQQAVPTTAEQMCRLAAELEEDGQLAAAAEMYRAAMAAAGPKAEICFQVAELLYRQGDLAGARERYYMAIELDEDYVEARANFGCVLAETGQRELAVAAFEGALRYHPDYADVHYHLARTLDEMHERHRAEEHWRAFVAQAPDSPWAEEARGRLGNNRRTAVECRMLNAAIPLSLRSFNRSHSSFALRGGVANSHQPCILNFMQEILFDYQLNPTTWAYISSLMMIGTYFKFHRFWSVRNLDLVGLIAFSPALLLMYYGLKQNPDLIQAGYVWLFAVSGFFLIRLLLDPVMVRRPLLEPNLSASGLTFTGISLLVFLMANVITSPPERLERMLAKQEALGAAQSRLRVLLHVFRLLQPGDRPRRSGPARGPSAGVDPRRQPPRTVTILAHLAVVMGMVWIGFRHFGNIHTGVAAATLYLLTFYTSQFTSQMDHVVPAMLLVWAVAAYRRPVIAGILLGLAGGMIYYPLFLLPLWCGFYWRRGLVRFVFGVVLALGVLVGSLAPISPDLPVIHGTVEQMFGWRDPFQTVATGFWQYFVPAYRIPVVAAFVAISVGLAIWPVQKNLGTLLSCSAAVMLATQFWHANQGGLYMAWYLPLLILTIFRPNLEDRVALSAVRPLWRRKA